MNQLRLLLYGIPALLLFLFLIALLNTASLSRTKKNEMSLGMSAQAVTLNPLQQNDAASAMVTGFLFNGLLKENENLELTGSLATDWSWSQITTFYFHTLQQAQAAKNMLEKEKLLHPHWNIRSLRLGENPTELLVTLQEPGYQVAEEISQLFPKEMLLLPAIEKTSEIQKHPFTAEPLLAFTLRHDVRWHDGAPFSSADVAFTYHAIMDDRVVSRFRSYFELISKIETPDPWHVLLHYRHPFSPALNSWTVAILPAHLLEKENPLHWGSSFNRHPIGTGPFCFDTWKSNEYIRLRKNKDYFLGAPWLDSIVFRVFPDPLTLRLAFQTHQIDFWEAPPWALKDCSTNPHYEIFSSPGDSYSYVGWNERSPLFADRKVRRALAHAVDVSVIIKYLLYGNGVPSRGIFTPRMWCFDSSIEPLKYDPQEAKRLLQEAGWSVGADGIRSKGGKHFSFTLMTSNGNGMSADLATLLEDDFRKIGIQMHIEVYEWTIFLKKLLNHDFDAALSAWTLPDDCDQYELWDSSQSFSGGLNYTGYSNAYVDQLLEKIRSEYARPSLMKLAHELQKTIYQDQPYLFLFSPKHTSVLWKGTYRVRYPSDHGFIDAPLTPSRAGWNYNMEWFYHSESPPGANTLFSQHEK